MALEFALRPRIDLERPAPRRRRSRIPRFALLMAAYWVGTASATVALLRILKDDPAPAFAAERAEPPPESTTQPDEALEPTAQATPPEPSTAGTGSVASLEPAAVAPEPAVESRAPEPLPVEPPTGVEPPSEPPRDAELRVSEPPLRAESSAPERPERRARTAPLEALASHAPESATLAHDRTPTPSERTVAPPVMSPPRAPEPAPVEPPSTALPSCEAAAASANETLDLRGAKAAPDLPREAFAAVLDNGAYLAACFPPARTALEICAAVKDGKVVGVSASSEPRNPALNACVRRAVAALHFPKSARLDVARTRFEAAR